LVRILATPDPLDASHPVSDRSVVCTAIIKAASALDGRLNA
jgi:hypothetical protein